LSATNPYNLIAGVIADMLKAEATTPVVNGRPMHAATVCELINAIVLESITLGQHKAQYPFDDRRVTTQAQKVNMLADHLGERLECK